MTMESPRSLATGIRDIDRGTEGLCYVMGQLFQPGVECRRYDQGWCDRCQCTRLGALGRYLDRLFLHQERLMDAGGYPQTQQHRQEHWHILEQLRALRDANVCADRDRAMVSEVVSSWLNQHITQADRRLGTWALSRRNQSPSL